jgi:oligopeptide/dipeptide ABC transporter ATP-binding protein
MNESNTILEVLNLRIHINTSRGRIKPVDGVSFNVNKGETVCLLGESGSGKSITAYSILGLLDCSPGMVEGNILFNGVPLYKNSKKYNKKIRNKISIVFQEPVTSLIPLNNIESQLSENITGRNGETRNVCRDILEKVKLNKPDEILKKYPYQLSGGAAQRVMIAIALLRNPVFLIADEPTSSLDTVHQNGFLDLLKEIIKERNLSLLFITHDISNAECIANKIIIMYAGKIVEKGKKDDILKGIENHPYTQGLINSIIADGKCSYIDGEAYDPLNIPIGCKFFPRCKDSFKNEICNIDPPEFKSGDDHYIKCWKYNNLNQNQI